MLFYILLSIAIAIIGWFAYNKYVKKEDTWSGSPYIGAGYDGDPSVDTLVEVSDNYKPTKITKKNTPKGIDLEGEWDVIEKPKKKAKRKYKPRKKNSKNSAIL